MKKTKRAKKTVWERFPWAGFTAVCSDGRRIAFSHRPKPMGGIWWRTSSIQRAVKFDIVEKPNNWDRTLLARPAERKKKRINWIAREQQRDRHLRRAGVSPLSDGEAGPHYSTDVKDAYDAGFRAGKRAAKAGG